MCPALFLPLLVACIAGARLSPTSHRGSHPHPVFGGCSSIARSGLSLAQAAGKAPAGGEDADVSSMQLRPRLRGGATARHQESTSAARAVIKGTACGLPVQKDGGGCGCAGDPDSCSCRKRDTNCDALWGLQEPRSCRPLRAALQARRQPARCAWQMRPWQTRGTRWGHWLPDTSLP